jgi:hypothetical protein
LSTKLNNNEFVPPHPLNTAVLFLVFNRPNTTKQVFESIRKAKPPRLYIAADGLREDRLGEEETVQSVRNYVMSNIDWNCEVKTLFRDKNLGCKYAVSGAITWFFEQEEMGIILEDDCLPSQSFFWFCEELLDIYKCDTRIMMVGGTNYFDDLTDQVHESYIFSRYFNIWGWATWKRAWSLYDVGIKRWSKNMHNNDLKHVLCNAEASKYFSRAFDLIKTNKIDTWDYQWCFTCLFNNGLSIVPAKNLISNIGVTGTHTANRVSENHFFRVHNLEIRTITHPILVCPSYYYDNKFLKEKLIRGGFCSKLNRLLKRVLK